MAVDWSTLRLLLRNVLLNDVTGMPISANRAWENRQFKPPNPPALWISEALLPIGETHLANGMIEAQGFYQINVSTERNRGDKAAQELALAIKTAFPPATSFSYSGLTISVDRSEQLSPVILDTWYQLPVQIRFRHYAFTP